MPVVLAAAVAISTTVLAAKPKSAAPPATPPAAATPTPAPIGFEPIAAHPEWDADYTAKIRAATTGPQFITPMVDHLPASATVPTPEKFLGYIAGAEGHLTYSEDVNRYMRALEAASPRVKVFSIGRSEEGREMILVAVADEATIADLDRYKAITRALADPRTLDEAHARALIDTGKPMYWVTGAMHSPETGSPEMLMELAYRLAVEDTPLVRSIRSNVITLITPVLEVDGRDRMVDLVRWHAANPDEVTPPLIYWGHYVAHDDNRDAIGVSLALSRNVLHAYLDWHPQVLHDLHESIPLLYISTGTGPYNAWLDPLMVDEWERMADHEVATLTAMGLPGVWTHGFYDGWAPNYMFWVAMGRNSIGRFYETFGNALPDTEDRVVRRASERAWFRPNPPLPKVRWSLRDNTNYEESGILLALSDMAEHRTHFLEQFYDLGTRSVAKARTEGPAAYVFDGAQKRRGQLRDLANLLRMQGIEVSVADKAFTIKPVWPPAGARHDEKSDTRAEKETAKKEPAAEQPLTFPAGSLIVRMDQPYSRLADTLLDTQYVRPEDRVYDDTGWTLGYSKNLECKRIVNPAVLDVPMHPWDGTLPAALPSLKGAAVAVENTADTDLVRLRYRLPDAKILVADEALPGKQAWPAGTLFIPLDDTDRAAVHDALDATSLRTETLAALPKVATHELARPRIAILHTWLWTQDDGWYRIALDDLKVPYTYISTQDVAREPDLRARFDVVIFPPVGRPPQEIVEGLPPGPPLPWKKTDLTPNLGAVASTDDMRPGLGLAGVQHLRRFVESGGLLVTVGDTAEFAIQFGLVRWVKVVDPGKLKAPGTLLRAAVSDQASPIAYGYDETLPVYFADSPVFKVGAFEEPREGERPSGRGGKHDPDVPQGRAYVAPPPRPTPGPGEEGFQMPEDYRIFLAPYMPRPEDRPRVVVRFAKEADKLLLSGMLAGGDEIAGTPVVIDAPLGAGHVMLFACNPMWRATTQGTYALVMNAVLNYDHLGLGWPPKGAK
jgi:hypothetical protein